MRVVPVGPLPSSRSLFRPHRYSADRCRDLILSHLAEGQIFSPLHRKALAFAILLSCPAPLSLGHAPGRQLPSMNRAKHRPRAPQSHAEPTTTPSRRLYEQSPKSSGADVAHHLFQPLSGPTSTSMSSPPSPRSSPNLESAATTTERPPTLAFPCGQSAPPWTAQPR
jgi:hypothetical protein